MPKVVKYSIKLKPAKVERNASGFTQVSFDLFGQDGAKVYEVEASTVPDLVAKIKKLAAEDFGQTCVVFCNPPRGERAPNGFKAAMSRLSYVEVEQEGLSTLQNYAVEHRAPSAVGPEIFCCQAEDEAHAAEQCINAHPDSKLMGVQLLP